MKEGERKATVRKLNEKINALKDDLAVLVADSEGKIGDNIGISDLMSDIDRLKEIRKRLLD